MGKLDKILRLFKQSVDMFKYNKIAKKYTDNEKYKDMWLLSERGVEAKDNAFVLFKYIRENHPEINAWYVIDSSYEKDYKRVQKLGNIIEYNSLEHKIAFLLCKYAISTHTGFLEPWSYKLYKLLLDRKNEKKFVFLQHGVIMGDLSHIVNSSNKLDLFITTTKGEYDSICGENYGFDKGVVVQTGLARYDNLNDYELKEQILLMPTWRPEIVTPSYMKRGAGNDAIFLNSEYYKVLNNLINNERLIKMLDKNNIDLIFYPHFEIQPFLNKFKSSSSRIILASKDDYSVQELLKESKLMITDYSSVAFDFAYMRKPILYYQKAESEIFNNGYFNYKKDGFGEVIFDEEELVDTLGSYFDNNLSIKAEYLDRVNESFNIRDGKNSERIYNAILNLEK